MSDIMRKVLWKGAGSPILYSEFGALIFLQGPPGGPGYNNVTLPDMANWAPGPSVDFYCDIAPNIEIHSPQGFTFGKPLGPRTKLTLNQGDWATVYWHPWSGRWVVRGGNYAPSETE